MSTNKLGGPQSLLGNILYGGPLQGPSLVSISPADLDRNVALDAPIQFVITASSGLQTSTLSVTVGGVAAITAGAFQPGFGGSITPSATDLDVTISTHPDFSDNTSISVQIAVTDFAATSGSWTTSFTTVAEVSLADSVPASASLLTQQQGTEAPTETVNFVENSSVSKSTQYDASETVSLSEDSSSQYDAHADALESAALTEDLGLLYETEITASEVAPIAESMEDVTSRLIAAHETVPVSITLAVPENDIYVDESVAVGDGVSTQQEFWTPLNETVSLVCDAIVRSFTASPTSSTSFQLGFVYDVALPETVDFANYSLEPVDEGYPLTLQDVSPILEALRTGSQLTVVPQDQNWSDTIQLADGTFEAEDVGRYLRLISGVYRILSVSGNQATVDGKLPVYPPDEQSWVVLSAVRALNITTSKMTNGATYRVAVKNLRQAYDGEPLDKDTQFEAEATKPKVVGATVLSDGAVVVEFDSDMRTDQDLTDPAQYSIPGVRIMAVQTVDATRVALRTQGMTDGAFTLTVNATGTPKDIAGNPLDPTFNQAIFTGSVPLNERSIFTDFGPITKPPEDLQTGLAAEIINETDVELPGSTILADHVGLYVILTGTSTNAGTYRITARLSSTRVRLKASFTTPDPSSGSITWTLRDPRDGQIADDPSDVTVLINGSPVTPDTVVGLLGQVILPTTPDPADDVKVDYHWCRNPTLEVRRLNSKEFRLNGWNRDLGTPSDTQHTYRFNTVLVTPTEYVPDDPQAVLDQPLLRDLHYRAYERAYSAVLNDPTLLTLNTPIHRIAYAPMSREILGEFIRYEAKTLPENDLTSPWTRKGSGTATVVGGTLKVTDDSSGPYPSGQPIFWTRDIDLSFPAAFATSWRGVVDAATEPDGVFVGVAAGHGDEERLAMVGMLLDGGVKKIGLLQYGGGNDPALLSAWGGGLDTDGNPTGAPAEFDWSTTHSYRTYRDPDGTIKVFVDGSVVETLRLARTELPFLEELDAPFEGLQGVFFGAPSRPARSESTWDFYRYLVLPLNPYQVAPTSFCYYEGDVLPEDAAKPWTPVGHHGIETLLTNDILLVDSTSASSVTDVGLATGDFRGFVRAEPLLPAASEVLLDVDAQLVTHTHGIAPNAVMAAVDDGNRLVQLCFFPDTAAPHKSYGGRALPTTAPWNWSSLGGADVEMVGQVLRITDDMSIDGRVFYTEDTASAGSTSRVVSGSFDWIMEFRCAVLSYTPETTADPKFAGVLAQVYDDTRLVGLMTCTVGGEAKLAWHSDGIVLSTIDYDWDDQEQHTYRITKSTSGDLVSLFVDGLYVASLAYSTFQMPGVVDPVGIVSFGSATSASVEARSTVDWTYANAWRVITSQRRYVGIWKGHDDGSLIGYHLPLKAAGRDASVAGNALGDPSASFLASGVSSGDKLIVDSGPNKGVYEIANVSGPGSLTIVGTFLVSPTTTSYRIPSQTDWTAHHRYRVIRSPLGDISVILDQDTTPIITLEYGVLDLPSGSVGVVRTLSTGLPAIAWGAFDPNNLSQVKWGHVRYGISRSPTELRIAPHHQLLNQWNVIASAEHLRTTIAHDHTGYKSCSTGIPPNTDPDLFDDPALAAYTQLNDDTPLVPLTQTWDVRKPQPVEVPISALNRIEDVLNTDPDFVLNDSRTRIEIDVPDDVLYTSLQVIEQTEGAQDLLKPFDDWLVDLGEIKYVKEVCLHYDGSVLPENDTTAPTPWTLASDNPAQVSASAFGGVLTYGTNSVGTRTVYRNNTPLTDAPGLEVEASYRIKVAQDTTWGLGDTLMRVGLSGLGYTIGLAFVTSGIGERLVLAYDLSDGKVLGSTQFDYLDGLFHTYKIIRDIKHGSVRIEVVA